MQDDQGRRDQPGARDEEEEAFLVGSERVETGGGESAPGEVSFAIRALGQGKDYDGDMVPPVRSDVLNVSNDPGGIESAPGMAWFALRGQGKDTDTDSPAE